MNSFAFKLILLATVISLAACNSREAIEGPINEQSALAAQFEVSAEELNISLAELEESCFTADSKIDSLSAAQGLVATIEAQLAPLNDPRDYAPVVNSLNIEKTKRDSLRSELETQIRFLRETLDSVEEKHQVLNGTVNESESESEDDFDRVDLLRNLQLKLTSVQLKTNNLESRTLIEVANIERFESELEARLTTPALIGDFIYNADLAIHFRSLCPSGSIDQVGARAGRVIDSLTVICNQEPQAAIGNVNGGDLKTPIACDPGFVSKGIYGTFGDSLDSFGLICAPADSLDSADPLISIVHGNENNGGQAYRLTCPARTTLVGISGIINGVSNYLERIYPICQKT